MFFLTIAFALVFLASMALIQSLDTLKRALVYPPIASFFLSCLLVLPIARPYQPIHWWLGSGAAFFGCLAFWIALAKEYEKIVLARIPLSFRPAALFFGKALLAFAAAALFLGMQRFDLLALAVSLTFSVAVLALALKSVFSSFFTYASFIFENLFELGEMVMVDDLVGQVEQIGWARMRIRARTGELIIVPNQQVQDGVVKNYSRMERRRTNLLVQIPFNTGKEALERISEMLALSVQENPRARLIAKSFTFKDKSICFEVHFDTLTKELAEMYIIRQQIAFAALSYGMPLYLGRKTLEINASHPLKFSHD